jgi:uncharacterized SAM-binding protein YcdF (DUF218 family)
LIFISIEYEESLSAQMATRTKTVQSVSSVPKKQIRRSLSWRKMAISLALIILVVLFLSYEYILRKIGNFLVFEQEPQKSDIIVVLNGRDMERALAAVDLHNKGYANLMVMARGSKQPGCDEFFKRVGRNWDSKTFFQRTIEAMGVPQKAFKLIGNGVTSTYDEAKVAEKFLGQNGYKSMVLVTSKWHSKRAHLTFESVFKDDKINIVTHPSQYDTFDPDSWWKNQPDAELLLEEYMRLLYYFVTLRISPLI